MALLRTNTGIGTTNPTSSLHVIGDGLFTGIVSATTFSGQINSGIGTFTSLSATNAFLTNINSSGISTLGVTTVTRLIAQSINSSGIVTGSSFRPSSGYIQAADGTNSIYIYSGTGNVAFQGTIGASQINNSQGYKVIGFAGTNNATFENHLYISGITTSIGGFVGNLTGIAASATKLQNSRNFSIIGDFITASVITFDGTSNVSLAATITPDSIGLGTYTTGDYVKNISGTSNQITVTGGTGEGSTPTLSIPLQFTVPQDLSVSRDLQVDRNLNVNGNITIGGTSAFIAATELKIYDPDIVLGFRSDAFGNDISTDNTANHGGIAIASTEGTPLISLYDVGLGETNPATYKKFMWFKSGSFTGLGTDAWISNYAIGIGSTQFPVGTRLAAGSVQFTENDLAVVRNINASGIITGTLANNLTLNTSGTGLSGIATYNNSGAITFTVTSNATDTNTVNTIVARDSFGNFSAGTINANLVGIASTAVKLLTPRNFSITGNFVTANSISFDGSGNVALAATIVPDSIQLGTYTSGNYVASISNGNYITGGDGGTEGATLTIGVAATSNNTANQIVARDSSGNFSAGTITANLAGTASTASFATTAYYLTDASNIINGIINSARLSGTYDININGNASSATYATTAGIATYATTAGVSTSVIGGIASVSQLNVSGVTTTTTLNVGTGGTVITTTLGSSRVGINSTTPQYTLDVGGDINFRGEIYRNQKLFTSGIGIYSGGNIISGSGTTIINFVGTAISSIVADVNSGIATISIERSTFTRTTTAFTASSNQSSFAINYTPGFIDVYVNGVRLTSSEYIATNGTSVNLVTPCFTGDTVDITVFQDSGLFSGSKWTPGNGNDIYRLNGSVGIGTNNPNSTFDLQGVLGVNTIVTNISTTNATTISNISASVFRSARYQVQITQGISYQSTDLMAIHDGTTASLVEYGTVATGDYLGSFSALVSEGSLLLQVTMTSATSATVKVVRYGIAV